MNIHPEHVVKLIRGTDLKLRISLGCVAVLGAGYMLRPPPPAPKPATPAPAVRAPAEDVAPILKEQVDQRTPGRVFRGVQDVGRQASEATVTVWQPEPTRGEHTRADLPPPMPDAPEPAGFGLRVSADEVLTHAAALSGRAQAALELSDGATRTGRAAVHEPETGLVLLRLDAPVEGAAPTRVASEPAAPGELAVVAARFDQRAFVAPVFIATTSAERYGLTAGGGAVRPGLPVFNVNVQALALAAGSAAPGTAFAVAPALERLRARLSAGPALPRSIGVRLQPLSPDLERHVGGPGALVAEVNADAPAERAGLRPGDVIVRAGAQAVTGVEEALRAIAGAGATLEIELRRAGATRVVELAPELALTSSPPAAPLAPATAAEAGAVFDAAALEAAQVPRTARVLAIDGRGTTNGRTAAALVRTRRAPWLVYVQDDAGRYFAVIDRAPRAKP